MEVLSIGVPAGGVGGRNAARSLRRAGGHWVAPLRQRSKPTDRSAPGGWSQLPVSLWEREEVQAMLWDEVTLSVRLLHPTGSRATLPTDSGHTCARGGIPRRLQWPVAPFRAASAALAILPPTACTELRGIRGRLAKLSRRTPRLAGVSSQPDTQSRSPRKVNLGDESRKTAVQRREGPVA